MAPALFRGKVVQEKVPSCGIWWETPQNSQIETSRYLILKKPRAQNINYN